MLRANGVGVGIDKHSRRLYLFYCRRPVEIAGLQFRDLAKKRLPIHFRIQLAHWGILNVLRDLRRVCTHLIERRIHFWKRAIAFHCCGDYDEPVDYCGMLNCCLQSHAAAERIAENVGFLDLQKCDWTFDLSGNTDRFTQTYLDDITGEFPRIDDRRAGLANRHGWYACANPGLPMFGALSGVVHVDGKGSRLGQYLLPAGDTISEPVFVARGDDAAEGDGWLLAAVWRAGENRSDLAVFNATDVEAGPVALVQLGHRVPDGFHGNWVAAA